MHKFITKSKVKASRGSPGSTLRGGDFLTCVPRPLLYTQRIWAETSVQSTDPCQQLRVGLAVEDSILTSLNKRGPSLKAPYRRRVLRSILLEGALKKRLDPVMHKFITKSKVKASRGSPGSTPEGGWT